MKVDVACLKLSCFKMVLAIRKFEEGMDFSLLNITIILSCFWKEKYIHKVHWGYLDTGLLLETKTNKQKNISSLGWIKIYISHPDEKVLKYYDRYTHVSLG